MAYGLMKLWWKGIGKNDAKRVAKQSAPKGVEETLDVAYIGDGDKYHTFDFYRPEGVTGLLPVIIDIHGGGWFYGDKDLNKFYAMSLPKYGFASASISYRLAPGVSVFEQIKDCAAAINHICGNAEKFGIDSENLFVTGDSAGGHLTAMMAKLQCCPGAKEAFETELKYKIKAVCYTCPGLEVSKFFIPRPLKFMGGGVLGEVYGNRKKDEKVQYLNFSYKADKYDIPSYFISAYGDMLKNQTQNGYNTVKDLGVDCGMTFFDEPLVEGHSLSHVYNILYPEWKESVKANSDMCAFFKKQEE